jgi:SAM-dependent methyltransferase
MASKNNSSSSMPQIPLKETWDTYWLSGDPGYPHHEAITQRVLANTGNADAIIVEIGSGLGVDAIEIASRGRSVIALDISREALKLMRERIKGKGIDVIAVVGDALNLPFKSGSIDLIYHQGVMEHFLNPSVFLLEQRRSLKSEGILLADVPQTFTWYTLRKKWAIMQKRWFAGWETQYTPRRLRRLLRSGGFRVTEIYGRDYDLNLLIRMSNIEKLGEGRFGHPIIPRLIGRALAGLWRSWEKLAVSNYIKLCIGAVAVKNENRN